MQILLVDDDPFVRDVAVTALSAVSGITVEACAGGAEALASLKTFVPDIVVLDLMMPELDGRATWAELRKLCVPLPRLIFLTARDDPATRAEVAALGANGLIAKPFDPTSLAARVLGCVDAATIRTIRLAAVTRNFARSLPATLSAIEDAWQAQAVETVLTEVHKIAGVAAMVGFQDVGDAANRVEELLNAAVKGGAAERSELDGAMRALMAAGAKATAS